MITPSFGSAIEASFRISPLADIPISSTADRLITLGAQQAQRQAELVVEISDRAQHRELLCREPRRSFPSSWSCRRCPVTPMIGPPHCRLTNAGKILQRVDGRLDPHDTESRQKAQSHAVSTTTARGLLLDRLLQEVVTVKPRPFDGKEQFSRIQSARVDGVAARRSRSPGPSSVPPTALAISSSCKFIEQFPRYGAIIKRK